VPTVPIAAHRSLPNNDLIHIEACLVNLENRQTRKDTSRIRDKALAGRCKVFLVIELNVVEINLVADLIVYFAIASTTLSESRGDRSMGDEISLLIGKVITEGICEGD